MKTALYDIDIEWQQNGAAARAVFTVESGVTALIGPSGAGKTTIAKMLTGLLTPKSGHISRGKKQLYSEADSINTPTAERNIGLVTQEAALFPTMNVRENIAIGSKLTEQAFSDLCADTSVQDLLDRNPKTLSGGEARRVSIARALAAKPQLLILDEPMNGLDPKRRKSLLSLIRKLSRDTQTPMLLITHQIEEMLIAADHAVLISDGNTVMSGSIEEVISAPKTSDILGIDDAGSVVTATVEGRSEGLLSASIGKQTILLADDREPIGSKLRLRILARDISIATKPIKNISILNQLSAELESISSVGHEKILRLKLSDDHQYLTARITEKSLNALALKEGALVHALIKAVAVKEVLTD